MGAAALMLAHQIAGKAARDALFLSQFSPSDLPRIVIVAALAALAVGYIFTRFLERLGPRLTVPAAYGLSALLHVAEWILLDGHRQVVVVAVYLHVVAFGAVLLSGFWSLAGEIFDPRAAKLHFGTIAGAGTFGGIAGGLVAERVGALASPDAVLLALAAFHLLAAEVLRWLSAAARITHPQPEQIAQSSARATFNRAPFLWSLAALVFLGTSSAALIDYLFKSGASATFGKGPGLLRFFALFYTGGQVATLLMQSLASRTVLQHLGLGRTVISLPLVVSAGSVASLMFPVFPVTAVVRALELMFRGSLFRAGYEIFYTPIPAADKRSVKTIIDVFCDRLGDAAGAALVQVLILLGPQLARAEILTAAILLSVASIWLARRMDHAYLGVLERGLLNRAVELDISEVQDSTTMSAVLRTNALISMAIPAPVLKPVSPARESAVQALQPADASVRRLAGLRSSDPAVTRKTLEDLTTPDDLLTPQIIRLLAWDPVADAARRALEACSTRVVGQLSDVLLDDTADFAIRRRIPRILARTSTQRAVDGLVHALRDPRFEVRFQCGRALEYIHGRDPKLDFREAVVLEVVDRELSVNRHIWTSHRILDTRDGSDDSAFLDEVLKERADQSLEHVFSLLSVVLPREPLKIAFRGLHSADRVFRGLSLEYLDGILPGGIREKLWSILETPPTPAVHRPANDVLADLMRSHQTLALKLADIRNPSGGADLPNGSPAKTSQSPAQP